MLRRPMPRTSSILLIVATVLAAPAAAQSGGIETLTGEMLFASGTRLSVSHSMQHKGSIYTGSDEVANPLGSSYTEHRTVFGFDYGVSSSFTLTALLPVISKSFEQDGMGNLNSAGIGDLAVLAKVLLHHNYWRRGGYHFAAAAGLEAPTGSTSTEDGGARLGPGMQSGSGSWDPFVSFSANLEADRWRFDAIAIYKENTEGAQDYEDGDDFAVDLVAAYRFLHAPYPGPSANVKLGLLYRHEGAAEQAGVTVLNSGNEQWLGRLAFAWHPQPAIDLSIAFDVPLAQDYDGTQLALDYRTSVAFGIRF